MWLLIYLSIKETRGVFKNGPLCQKTCYLKRLRAIVSRAKIVSVDHSLVKVPKGAIEDLKARGQ